MTKKELRKLYLEKRKSLSEKECATFSLTLCSTFFTSVDLSLVKVLHTYLPIKKNNEPDSWMIVDRLRKEFPGIGISVPRVGSGDELENIFLESPNQLDPSRWSIPEPREGVPTSDEEINLVIIPLLAFDQQGHRVGYGRGFYDRFLRRCKPDCMKIGLSFFEAVEVITDTDKNDMRLNRCITPKGIVTF